MNFEHLNLQ